MRVESWVQTSVGIFSILGSVFFVVLLVVTFVGLLLLSDLTKQVKALTGKVDKLADKVHGIADQVNAVTTEVGARTTGIVRMVDEGASKAIGVLEVLAPVLVVIGAFMKVRRAAGGPVRRRR